MKIGPYEIKLEKRTTLSNWDATKIAIIALIASLAIFSIIFIQAGVSPIDAYKEIFLYAFRSDYGVPLTVHRFVFLLLCSLAFMLPFRAGLWNIGATGQMYAGALGAFGILYVLGVKTSTINMGATTVIPLMIIGAILAGAAVAGIAGFLKGKLEVNEILVTMMINFALLWFTMFMIQSGGPFMGAGGRGESFSVPESFHAPMIGDYSYTIIIALGITVFLYFLLAKTTLGYKIKALGESPEAARYSGISSLRITIIVFLIGGAIAGFAGYHWFGATPGVYKISRNFSVFGDMAFYGIVIGLIALGKPFGAIPMSFVFSALSVGGRWVQGMFRMSFGVDYALLGITMIVIIAFQFFYRHKIVLRKRKGEG